MAIVSGNNRADGQGLPWFGGIIGLAVGLEPIPKGIVINKQRSFLGAKNGG